MKQGIIDRIIKTTTRDELKELEIELLTYKDVSPATIRRARRKVKLMKETLPE